MKVLLNSRVYKRCTPQNISNLGAFQHLPSRLFPEPPLVLTGKEPWLCTAFHSHFHNCAGTRRKRRNERVELLCMSRSPVSPELHTRSQVVANRSFLHRWRDSLALIGLGKSLQRLLQYVWNWRGEPTHGVFSCYCCTHDKPQKSSRLKFDCTIFYHPPGIASSDPPGFSNAYCAHTPLIRTLQAI